MVDAIIAGAGPAGAIAALVMARAGARVVIIDRDAFPRDKLCGDTLNPGGLRQLAALGLSGGPLERAWPLVGMRVTGPRSVVLAEYGDGQAGLALPRRDLDAWLIDAAVRAGAKFESGLVARRPVFAGGSAGQVVRGLVVSPPRDGSREIRLPARLTIAADGRRSSLARAVGLTTAPRGPRRWAFGVYAHGVTGNTSHGEMHIRPGGYIGVAPLSATLTNICVVTHSHPVGQVPLDVVRRATADEPMVRERLARAEFVGDVRVLGPLAAEVRAPGVPGLLLAGDAGGFIDPMTGDGLTLAIQSACLAANEALRTLESNDLAGAPARLERARHRAFGGKLRFNRAIRTLVEHPPAIEAAAIGARMFPAFVRKAIRYAGDVR